MRKIRVQFVNIYFKTHPSLQSHHNKSYEKDTDHKCLTAYP